MRRVRQTGIRLSDSLIAKLKREAARRHVSFNDEVRMRLEDSLENKDAPRALDDIQESMRVIWERYANRLTMPRLEEDFVKAVLQSTDTAVVAFANMWLIDNARDQQLDQKWNELPDLKRPPDPRRPRLPQKEIDALMRAAKPRTLEPMRSTKKGKLSS